MSRPWILVEGAGLLPVLFRTPQSFCRLGVFTPSTSTFHKPLNLLGSSRMFSRRRRRLHASLAVCPPLSLFLFHAGDAHTLPCGDVNNENMYSGGEELMGEPGKMKKRDEIKMTS